MVIAGCVLPQQGNCFSAMPRPLDLPGRAPVLEQLDVEVAGAVEDVEEALLVLERVGVGVKSALGQQRREQAVAADWPICSGLVMVPKFAFRPLASEAAMHSAIVGLRASRACRRWPAAAAVPKMPSVAVGCQPLS